MGNQSSSCCQNFTTQNLYEISNPFNLKTLNQSPFYEIAYHQTKIIYRGQLKNNIPHGKGTQMHPDGDVYEGIFVNGVKQGFGTYCFADGTKYQGNFICNKMEGRGLMLFANGDIYDGQFMQNTMEGFGIYKCKSEDSQYRGYYSNGVKHGQGQILFNGVRHKGVWNNGIFRFV